MPILPELGPSDSEPSDALRAWAASGAMALTGRRDGPPLGPPAGLVTKLRALGGRLTHAARALGGEVVVDPLALLGERAALGGLHRRGATSVGGATRLLEVADGWLAVSLARPDDVAMVPAWLELPAPADDPWRAVTAAVAVRPGAELLERARLLGLPVAALPAAGVGPAPAVESTALAPAARTELPGLTVVELGSLWAGPLCGALLSAAGAQVVKVESTTRPDGARRGPVAFFDLLNAGKQSVALDLRSVRDVTALRELLAGADVVIEASRPRALEQLRIDAAALVAADGPRAWLSITGHGRRGPARDWVAFGDDAAVAGGLVAWDGPDPVFCADAIADPATGLVAAVAALEALASGGRHLVDVPLTGVAAHLAGPTQAVAAPVDVAAPWARRAAGRGPALGQHTAEVLARLG